MCLSVIFCLSFFFTFLFYKLIFPFHTFFVQFFSGSFSYVHFLVKWVTFYKVHFYLYCKFSLKSVLYISSEGIVPQDWGKLRRIISDSFEFINVLPCPLSIVRLSSFSCLILKSTESTCGTSPVKNELKKILMYNVAILEGKVLFS